MSFAANASAFGSPIRYSSTVAKQRDEIDDEEHEMLRIMNMELRRRREAQIEWLMAPFPHSESLLLPEHPSDDEKVIRGVSPSSVTLIDYPTHNSPESSHREMFSRICDTRTSFSCQDTPKKPCQDTPKKSSPLPRDSWRRPLIPSQWLEDSIQPSSTRLKMTYGTVFDQLDDVASRCHYHGK